MAPAVESQSVDDQNCRRVKRGWFINEPSLQEKIPEERNGSGDCESSSGKVTVGFESDCFEPLPTGQDEIQALGSEGVKEYASNPNEDIFDDNRFPGDVAAMESEVEVNVAVNDSADDGAHSRSEAGIETGPSEEGETGKEVDPGSGLGNKTGAHQGVDPFVAPDKVLSYVV